MDASDVTRTDFPRTADGYDRASVDAHLAAVAAQLTALEARIASYEVEREALRRQTADASPAEVEVISEAATPPVGNRVPAEPAPAAAAGPTTTGEPRPQPPSSHAEDEVSARLIATKMTLDGADRETIRLRLADGYDVDDLDALLDDVIERVG